MIDISKMSDEEYVPFGAEIHVSDFERSLKFYRDVLGFKVLRIDQEWPFASFIFHDSIFMIDGKGDYPLPRGQGAVLRFILHGGLSELQKFQDLVESRGVIISKPVEKLSYGLTRFYLADPDGYQLKFAVRDK